MSIFSTNSSVSPSERLGRAEIPLHEPCFVTKRPGYALEKAHLVNAPRRNKMLKSAVERFLEFCHIVALGFNLNFASNLIPLDQNLYTLARLGFIALTCFKKTLLAMLQVLFEDPFSNAEYELVVLRPDHFLPIGSTITMHTQRPVDPSRLVGKLYMVGEDGALREDYDAKSPRFPAFSAFNARDDIHRVNPFLVILKADLAFQRLRRLGDDVTQRLCSEYAELVDLTMQVADAIYHPSVVRAASRAYFAQLPEQTEGGSQKEDENMDPPGNFGSGARADEEITPQKRIGGVARSLKRKRKAAKYSRLGVEISTPGPDASDEHFRDFASYILSGRGKSASLVLSNYVLTRIFDVPLTTDDEAILKSIGLYPGDED
ncbi:hypothetical protein D9619_006127 [Psilocybe cf. subviscida]|uniref:Uncharacterized protein n=1 Tax=Psilocybe cf. subviscida TaxID=2480587 RepID=A0A8H5B4N1_9AGAR|nr:hypothetical protein D9619_006127 [Psilocybe cf. subviscida]